MLLVPVYYQQVGSTTGLQSTILTFLTHCIPQQAECDEGHIKEWISTVIRHKVEEFILSIEKEQSYMLPHCLFSCESLRILKINMRVSMNVHSPICFSRLKVLHLERIAFCGAPSMQEFSLSFPMVEDFYLHNCAWLKVKTVNIYVPILKVLKIVEWRSKDLPDCEIRIYAESLVSLKLKSDLSYEYSLFHLSSLIEAFIDVPKFHVTVHRVGSLLRGISHVRDLELTADSIETLCIPTVSEHMHFLSRVIRLRVMDGRLCGKKLINFLGSMPNIESLYFPMGIGSFSFKGNGRIIGTTPQCYLSHLKLVNIPHFTGIAEERWFIKFLIKSVKVMDKLTIKLMKHRYNSSEGWIKWTAKEMENLVQGTNCVLEFPLSLPKGAWRQVLWQ